MLSKRNDYWVPERDEHCFRAITFEQNNVARAVSFVPRKRVCVQAGGNFGVFPKLLSQHFGMVYTFEPHPENFQALVLNTEGCDNIIKFQAGLGSKRLFSLSEPDPNNFGAFQANLSGNIPCLPLDSIPLENCDLLWLDIEGGEYDAIANAKETINKFKPVIVLEFRNHVTAFGHTEEELETLVNSFGYRQVGDFGSDRVFQFG